MRTVGALPSTMAPCVACTGRGLSSKGEECKPCGGIGLGPWLSPSRVKTASQCMRKWRYSLDREEPQGAAAQYGERVHGELEAMLRTGALPTLPEARAIALQLPPLSSSLLVESWLYLPRGGFGYRGKVDLIDVDSRTIFDHKTSSDPKRYGVTSSALAESDPQGIIYAAAACEQFDWPSVSLVWNFAKTRKHGRDRAPSVATVHRDEALERLATVIDPIASAMFEHMRAPVDSVPADTRACSAYGGCHYRSQCSAGANALVNPFAKQEGSKIMAFDRDAILKKIRENQAPAGAAPATPAAPAAEPAASTAAPAAGGIDAVKARIAAMKGSAAPATDDGAAAKAAAEAEAKAKAAELAAAEAAKAKATPAKATPANASIAGLTLYIDCLPVGDGSVTDATDLVNAAASLVAVETKVAHWRFVEFGKGKGAMDLALAAVVTESGASSVFVTSGNEFADTLRGLAARVVTAVR